MTGRRKRASQDDARGPFEEPPPSSEPILAHEESLQAFAYSVSHDLKEPVRGLQFLLQVAQEEYGTQEGRDALARAVNTGERLDRLVRGLLEWSRACIGGWELERVDVKDILRGDLCSILYEHLKEERGGRLDVSEEPFPRVLATPQVICQVFGNLIVNGFKHNPSSTPVVRVRLGETAEKDAVDILVEDNGPGFHANTVRRFQGKANPIPSSVTTGFGLTIARRAVERLGGSVTLGSSPEGGAQVRVRLPAADTR